MPWRLLTMKAGSKDSQMWISARSRERVSIRSRLSPISPGAKEKV